MTEPPKGAVLNRHDVSIDLNGRIISGMYTIGLALSRSGRHMEIGSRKSEEIAASSRMAGEGHAAGDGDRGEGVMDDRACQSAD
jgi:hypothetical protein